MLPASGLSPQDGRMFPISGFRLNLIECYYLASLPSGNTRIPVRTLEIRIFLMDQLMGLKRWLRDLESLNAGKIGIRY